MIIWNRAVSVFLLFASLSQAMVPMAMATAAAGGITCAVAQGLPVAGSNEKSGVPGLRRAQTQHRDPHSQKKMLYFE